jgi:signal transduction histidine kinase/ActR/RegA family two-component response regulator
MHSANPKPPDGTPGILPRSLSSGSRYLPKRVGIPRPRNLLELACKATRATHGGLGLLSTEGELLEHFTFGIPAENEDELRRHGGADDLVRYLLESMETLHHVDLSTAATTPPCCRALPPTGPVLRLALATNGRRGGVLYLARPAGATPFGPQEEEIILALQTSLEQAALFDEARLLAQIRLLNQVAQAAAGSLELLPILAVASREIAWHLPRKASLVWLIEEEDNGPKTDPYHGNPTLRLADMGADAEDRAAELGLRAGMRMCLDETHFAGSLRDGQAVYSDLSLKDEQTNAHARNLAAHGGNSSIAVPLRAGERVVGILESVCTRSEDFTNEQAQLLYLVADLLGPAISNCQLFGQLRRAYDELRQTQSQLIQAEKMRALGELAGGMAHDFNNSLCGVLGFLDLALTDQSLTLGIRGYLESAHTSALDAAHTVRRVQNFARWQRNELSSQLLDINRLVEQTLELTRHKWENLSHTRSGPITLEVETKARLSLHGSDSELREVITNLVFNAVDAMPDGGRLVVRTWDTGTDVFLSVQDDGVGMTDAVRQRLFEPFFTTKEDRGNGLGLSVTFGIVQRFGGEITVKTQPGAGSTFELRFPANARTGNTNSPGKLGEAGPDEAANGKPQAAAVPALSLRILVVEDEESIRRFLEAALTQLGHRPRITADAPSGIKALESESFDLVLSDLGLPGVSGEEVARTVARRSPAVPVVLLTGWSDQLRNEAKPLEGVTCVLGKPVTIKTLADTISQVCPKSRVTN